MSSVHSFLNSFTPLYLPAQAPTMRITVASALALAYATAVLASPMKRLQVRQNGDDDDDDGPSTGGNSTSNNGDDDADDAVLYSPANLTTVNPGSTFNFSYLCDDDDCSSVRVALIQYIEVSRSMYSAYKLFFSGLMYPVVRLDCHWSSINPRQRRQSRKCPAHCSSQHHSWSIR